jgi:hypothetical protein
MSQYSEFCRHNPSCCFSTTVYCFKRTFRYDLVRKLLDTPSYGNYFIGSRDNPASYLKSTTKGSLPKYTKATWSWNWLPQSSVEDRNAWSFTSTSPLGSATGLLLAQQRQPHAHCGPQTDNPWPERSYFLAFVTINSLLSSYIWQAFQDTRLYGCMYILNLEGWQSIVMDVMNMISTHS